MLSMGSQRRPAQCLPRAPVECTPRDQPKLALLLVLINGDLVYHPVGVGRLDSGCALANAPYLPAGTVQYAPAELGHGIYASGLLHG